MKLLRYITIFILIVALGGSCTTNFDDYNKNPNVPEEGTIGPSSLLEETLYSGADGFLDRTKSFNGELMQYTVSGTTLNSYHRYYISNAIMAGTWNHLYRWATNADHMYALAEIQDPNNELPLFRNSKAVSLTLKVLYVSNVTDIFGDVPYSEAFEIREGKTKPRFDTQKEVYETMLKELETANDLYDTSASIPAAAKDLMYGGDMTKWKKFTNSLRLRLLMRLLNRDSEMGVSQKILEIVNNPVKYPLMERNSDNAALYYTGSTPFVNRYGNSTESDFTSDRKIADNIISMMTGTNDPRLPLYFKQSGSVWKGLISGEAVAGDTENVALLNKTSLGLYTSPYAFMKHDEVMFILAEAAKRGVIPGGDAVAKTYYDQALRSSVEWWNSVETSGKFVVDEATITRFINNDAKYNNSLTTILNQKYIAMFWVGYEAWHDYRRTGYPELKIGSGTEANNYTLPTRFEYPINVQKTNPENYAEAVSRLKQLYKGEDNMRAPVWWSKDAVGL